MTGPVKDAAVYSDLNSLAALKRGATASDPNTLRQVAKQFESVFAKMMLTSMRQATSSFGDPLFGSDQTQFYQGMFDDQLSVELTKGKGLGLADMLVRQLQKVTGATDAAKTDATTGGDAKAGNALKMPSSGTASMLPLSSARSATAGGAASAATGMRSGTAAMDATAASAADFALARQSGLFGEPDAADSGDALADATQFVQKMLAGNAQANGTAATNTDFRTPTSPEDFVQQLWPCAAEAGRELGVDPTHLLAQAALETGWGKSLPCDANGNPSFNFFGIKAGTDWTGDTVATRTLEFQGGVPVPQVAHFRAYESAQDSFRDYVALLRDNPRYAAALNTGNDAKAFATALQRGGYATDPAYAQKIASIAQNLGNSAIALKSSGSQPIP
jgi:flagellar protein FlgJ